MFCFIYCHFSCSFHTYFQCCYYLIRKFFQNCQNKFQYLHFPGCCCCFLSLKIFCIFRHVFYIIYNTKIVARGSHEDALRAWCGPRAGRYQACSLMNVSTKIAIKIQSNICAAITFWIPKYLPLLHRWSLLRAFVNGV